MQLVGEDYVEENDLCVTDCESEEMAKSILAGMDEESLWRNPDPTIAEKYPIGPVVDILRVESI